ncbi:hypothetical protein MKEN_01100000 [Mycena kentingensis (nom. inval.)]|nr:hypothetical protein MKEN_01100000 [Mycena kentingensis (nom. inval.)]
MAPHNVDYSDYPYNYYKNARLNAGNPTKSQNKNPTNIMSANKVILVTGSNGGIGHELVKLLAAKGHTVYLASRGEKAGLEAVEAIKKENDKFVQLDITDIKSVEAAAAKIKSAEGRLDVLVNNAGIAKMEIPHSAVEPNFDAIRATFETNLIGTMQTTITFLPLLRAASTPDAPAVIVNVSTDMSSNTVMSSGKEAFRHKFVAYNTSKAAQNSYTIALAHELSAEGIKVNAVTPGFTSTKLTGFGAAGGAKTSTQGAEIILPWCLLGKDGQTGTFNAEGGSYAW